MTWWELAALVVWGPPTAVAVALSATFVGIAARDRLRAKKPVELIVAVETNRDVSG